MQRFYSKFLLVLLLMIVSMDSAYSGNLYGECILASNFGSTETTATAVRTVGDICYRRCQVECNAFARKPQESQGQQDNKKPISDSELQAFNSLNQDLIDECIYTCQSGNIFESSVRIAATENNPPLQDYKWSSEKFKTGSKCSTDPSAIDSAEYAYFDAGVEVKQSEEVFFYLIAPFGFSGNQAFLCGMKSVKLDPLPELYICERGKNQDIFNNAYDVTKWSGKNYNWTDTGIDMKDGDILSIQYGNKAFMHHATQINASTLAGDQILMVRDPRSGFWRDMGVASYLPGNRLKSIKYDSVARDSNNNPTEAPKFSAGHDPETVEKNNRDVIWYGLKASMSNSKAGPTLPFLPDSCLAGQEFYKSITFSGKLSGFTGGKFTRLGLKHYDSGSMPAHWLDNLGGYKVDISWRGCVHEDGDRLEYAVVKKEKVNGDEVYFPQSAIWYPISQDVIKNHSSVKMPSEGQLFLRIAKYTASDQAIVASRPYCNSSDSVCANLLHNVASDWKYSRANTGGQYYINVQKKEKQDEGIISPIVNKVYNYLFGGGSKKGIVYKVYNNLVVESSIVQGIRALLVLYIAYTGLSFIIGTAQITQKEGLIRLIRIGVVLTLISPSSWEFFYHNLFQMFVRGSIDLIIKMNSALYANLSSTITEQDIISEPMNIFKVFDEGFTQLFSGAIWAKVIGLAFSNLVGFLMAIVMIVGIVTFAMCIVKVAMIYMVSLVVIGLLLMLAPLFISFVLFNYTKQLFDNWIKQLMSCMLQPVIAFVAVGFLYKLLLVTMYVSLGFTVCKMCLFGIHLPPFYDECYIHAYKPIMLVHTNPGAAFTSPIGVITVIFCFAIIAHAMHAFCSISSQIANIVVSGSLISGNLSQIANASDPISSTIGSKWDYFERGARKLFMDKASYARWSAIPKHGRPEGMLHKVLGIDRGSKNSAKAIEKNVREALPEKLVKWWDKKPGAGKPGGGKP